MCVIFFFIFKHETLFVTFWNCCGKQNPVIPVFTFFTRLLSEQVKSKAVCAGGENKVALHLCAATIIRFIFS